MKHPEPDHEAARELRCPRCRRVEQFAANEQNIRTCGGCGGNYAFQYPHLDVEVTLNRTDLVALHNLLEQMYCFDRLGPVNDDEHAMAHVMMKKLEEANPLERPLTQNGVMKAIPLAELAGTQFEGFTGSPVDLLKKLFGEGADIQVVGAPHGQKPDYGHVANLDANELKVRLDPKPFPEPPEPNNG